MPQSSARQRPPRGVDPRFLPSVGRVSQEGKVQRLTERLSVRSSNAKQRPRPMEDERARTGDKSSWAHRAQGARAGPSPKSQENRFRLVIKGVPENHVDSCQGAAGAPLGSEVFQDPVPGRAGRSFQGMPGG